MTLKKPRTTSKSKPRLPVTPALLVSSSCTFNGGINTWDLTAPNKLELKVVQATGDPAPMVKIYYNNTEVQCIPAGIARNWRVMKESSTYFFRDEPATAAIDICSKLWVFCLRHTGHENALTLKVIKYDQTAKFVFVGTDDIRDGAPVNLTDYVFNIHNENATNSKSVNIILRPLATGSNLYDFSVAHSSGNPTLTVPSCVVGSLPTYMCARPV
jgi:hypothetical protein